jgi:hypothetical protein
MSTQPPTPYLRASDADREAAVERLRLAAVDGRLDSDELEERLADVYRARWTTDLERLTADVTPRPRYPVPLPPPTPVMVQYQPRPATNGLAVTACIAGLIWFWWIGSLAAIVFGHAALGQIKRSNGWQTGRGMAIAGLVLGYLEIAGLLIKLVFYGA